MADIDYRKKIKSYYGRILHKKTLQFVDFLDIVFEWMDELYVRRRLRIYQEKFLSPVFPHKTMAKLDEISIRSPDKISDEEYVAIKAILLTEAKELINGIIALGSLRPGDFDSVQFNLNQVFIKEEITAMIEWARLHLQDVIKERKDKSTKERKKNEKEQNEYLSKLSSMSEKELTKYLINSMFDFTPGARTPDERLNAITNNQTRINSQRNRFTKFEDRLVDAIEDARKEAQFNINKQIGQVTTEMYEVSEKFRNKAQEFASDEGPKKKILGAKDRINFQKKELSLQLVDVGKDWEEAYRKKTIMAQEYITGIMDGLKIHEMKLRTSIEEHSGEFSRKSKDLLHGATIKFQEDIDRVTKKFKIKSKEIQIIGQEEMHEATTLVLKGKGEFEEDVEKAKSSFEGKGKHIVEQGKQEMAHAKERVIKEKEEFYSDVGQAQSTFYDKKVEITYSQEELGKKRDKAATSIIDSMKHAEEGMTINISEGKKKFEFDTETAREKFLTRADEISDQAKKHISSKQDQFKSQRELARGRFVSKSERLSKSSEGREGGERFAGKMDKGREEMVSKASVAKTRLESQQKTMMKTADSNREEMIKEIHHRKDLFILDVKFAKHKIHLHAKNFAEKTAEKREEFETTQETIVSRHRAQQKALLIRNLLKVIRGMH
jgi:hypothetical protein